MRTMLIAALLASAAAFAQERATPLKGGVVAAREADITARVEKVDRAKNSVTMKDKRGEKIKITVSPDVKSLEDVKPGSRLKVHYIQSTALAIAKPETSSPMGKETVHVAPKSGTPADVEINTGQIVGTIQDLDRSKRELTLKTPDDRKMTFDVAEEVPGFEQAKIGDKVLIRYSEAFALSAESQQPKAPMMKY